ncbi:MAG: LptF/LptG family permease [Cytophagales bacterium]|nr:LptF/LptG family permease [Cytophagales bacterium]
MKKIDKLILTSFIGPFVLTFLVVVFILLNIHMLKYFDDIIGKDLGWDVIGQLLFYFAVFNTPVALPLAVLLSSLITFGNLGEHFELTAIKSLGISMLRSLLPIFIFVLFITLGAFLVGNYMVPKAALEAYSLLYDIKQKKPALDLRQGTFYNSIPGISIKVNHKNPETGILQGVIIYDHRGRSGNKEVIVADSGKMYTILNDSYLKLELFHGYNYLEGNTGATDYSSGVRAEESYRKTQFNKSQIVFDLSSFGLNRTDKKWFQSNRLMRNMSQLRADMDSVRTNKGAEMISVYASARSMFTYHTKKDSITMPPEIIKLKAVRDSLAQAKTQADATPVIPRPTWTQPEPTPVKAPIEIRAYSRLKSDSLFKTPYSVYEISTALSNVRLYKSQLLTYNERLRAYENEYRVYYIQWHKIMAQAIACIAMFLIGAPLGAIIKKGGLGVPVLMSILFFILFYVLSLMGEKWAKQAVLGVELSMWLANITLFAIGLLFLRQARADARLFDADFYSVAWDRLRRRFSKK